jgi:hypothetical protein
MWQRVTFVTCQHCGRSPARAFTVRRHVGLLFLMRNVRIEQTLCRECARRELGRYTGRTLVEGWWGILSLVIFNPLTIALNVWNMARSLFMKSPQLPNAAFGDGDHPTSDHLTLLIPIAIGLLCLLGIAGVVFTHS